MKRILLIFHLFFLTGSLHAQGFEVLSHTIEEKSSRYNYELKVVYPEIKDPRTSQIDFNSTVSGLIKAQADTFRVWMLEWDTISTRKEMGSYFEINYSISYKDDELISAHFYVNYYFAGAAHPNNSSFSLNYDLDGNREVFFKDLFKGSYLKRISEICVKDITIQRREFLQGNEEPDEWVLSGAGPKEENFKVFNLTNKELIITFPTYQVASYAEGPKEVIIPYNKIRDIIDLEGPAGRFLR